MSTCYQHDMILTSFYLSELFGEHNLLIIEDPFKKTNPGNGNPECTGRNLLSQVLQFYYFINSRSSALDIWL